MYSNGLFGLVLLSGLLVLYISTVGAQFSPVVDLDSMNTYLFVLLPPMYGFIWYTNHRNLKQYRTQALQGVTYAIDSSRNHSTSGAIDEDSMTDFSRFLFLELQRHHGQPGQSPFSLVLPAEYEDALATADSHDEFLKRVLHDRGLLDESVDADELDAYRLRVVPDSDGPEQEGREEWQDEIGIPECQSDRRDEVPGHRFVRSVGGEGPNRGGRRPGPRPGRREPAPTDRCRAVGGRTMVRAAYYHVSCAQQC
jgi:hypothetical protein